MPDPILPQLSLQVIFILISGFFAAADSALNGLNESAVRAQAEQGDKKAARMLKVLEAPAHLSAAIQAAIILTGLLAAAFAAKDLTVSLTACFLTLWGIRPFYDTIIPVAIILILTFVYLIFGQMVPRRAAAQRPEQAARLTFGTVLILDLLFRPFIWVQTACANGILRLMRLDPDAGAGKVSEDEIMAMVDMGEESGAIESAEKELIENVFEFNNITAGDVMIHRTDMVLLWVGDKEEEILHTIEESGLSRFPVDEEDADDILGILSPREYLLNLHKPAPLPIRALLRPAYFVPDSVRADLLFRDMQSKAVHLAIVVDEYGGTSGLVTMEDLLEELVGNIYDEFDPKEEQEIIQLQDNLWRVSGSAELETVAEALGIDLPGEELYDTLGGLIYSQLSVIPEDGAQPEVSACGLRIRVEELSDRRVEWALVSVELPEGVKTEEAL